MGDSWEKADWEFVEGRIRTVQSQLRAKGARIFEYQPLKPIPGQQLAAVEKKAGHLFPPDFVDLVTKFTGGWKFGWGLVKAEKWTEPLKTIPPFAGTFGGNAEVFFIGGSAKTPLFQHYDYLQKQMIEWDFSGELDRNIARALFPLHTFEGGGGNFSAIDLRSTPTRVYYLDHEIAHCMDEEHLIGVGFREFVMAWARLGFPELGTYSCFTNSTTHLPDDSTPEAKAWLEWLADPKAK